MRTYRSSDNSTTRWGVRDNSVVCWNSADRYATAFESGLSAEDILGLVDDGEFLFVPPRFNVRVGGMLHTEDVSWESAVSVVTSLSHVHVTIEESD